VNSISGHLLGSSGEIRTIRRAIQCTILHCHLEKKFITSNLVLDTKMARDLFKNTPTESSASTRAVNYCFYRALSESSVKRLVDCDSEKTLFDSDSNTRTVRTLASIQEELKFTVKYTVLFSMLPTPKFQQL
jgi:hypothetical protein